MNVHLFVIFGTSAEHSPLAVGLRAQGLSLTTFCDAVQLNFQHKVLRYLLGWPRLLWFSVKSVYRSQRHRPQAHVAIVNSHFDVLVFALFQILFRTAIPKLVLPGFIYTENGQGLARRLKWAYYRWILGHASAVICHSNLEVKKNRERFPALATRFLFFPYGIHVHGADGYADETVRSRVAVSAGRSARDYPLLIEAARDVPVALRIICDFFGKGELANLPANVTVLGGCYGGCYFDALASARFVVIPLRVTDISAGQMVLLQAMALGKPVIITRTATTVDYVQDGDGVIVVEPGDRDALAKAMLRLATDDELCAKLGRRGAALFSAKFSMDAYARNLARAATIAYSVNGAP